jgi:hypothetical protein
LLIPAPTCDLPQLPPPFDIVIYTPDDFLWLILIAPTGVRDFIIVPQWEWALLGGYLYAIRGWVKAAGPCLLSKSKPAQPATEGTK